jgi:hypothetical protein
MVAARGCLRAGADSRLGGVRRRAAVAGAARGQMVVARRVMARRVMARRAAATQGLKRVAAALKN